MIRHFFRKKIIFLLVLFVLAAFSSAESVTVQPFDEFYDYYLQNKKKNSIEVFSTELKKNIPESERMIILHTLYYYYSNEYESRILMKIFKYELKKISNPLFRNSIKQYILNLYFQMGSLQNVENIRNSMGYISFKYLGPFHNSSNGDFNKAPEKNFYNSMKDKYNGRFPSISWQKAPLSYDGSILFDNFAAKRINSAYYLSAYIKVNKKSTLVLGKTGRCTVWIDGKKIFSRMRAHNFNANQYLISLEVSKKKQHLVIKVGDYNGNIHVSARIMNLRFNKVKSSELRNVDLYSFKKNDHWFLFKRGFLLNISGFSTKEFNLSQKIMSSIPPKNRSYEAANYFLSSIIDDKKDKMKYLLRCSEKPLVSYQKIMLYLENNQVYRASKLVERIKGKSDFIYRAARTMVFLKKQWYILAWHEIRNIEKNHSTEDYLALYYHYYKKKGLSSKAAQSLEKRIARGFVSVEYFSYGASLYAKSGLYNAAQRLLREGILRYPDNIDLRIELSSVIGILSGVQSSLVYLSGALIINKDYLSTLQSIGDSYRYLGKTDTAIYYYNRCLEIDPGNSKINEYKSYMSDKKNIIAALRYKKNIKNLYSVADTYKSESKIILLREIIYLINNDGSFEKFERVVEKINNKKAVQKKRIEYIVYSPKTDNLQEVTCKVINGSSIDEINSRYTQSLSEPESRLYYDQRALIIPLRGIKKGTIVDFSYKIKRSVDSDFKKYFGEGEALGGRYAILKEIIHVVYPETMKLKFFNQKIDGALIKKGKLGNKLRVSIIRNNIPGEKIESSKPHSRNTLPFLCFTTAGNWKDFISWYSSLVVDQVRVTKEMIDAIKEIKKTSRSDKELIEKIYMHVTDRVRYVGFELGVGGIKPRSTDKTYSTAMGDCKDTALLLVAMLRKAGFKAYLALVRTNDKGYSRLNFPWVGEFNHAICYVDYKGGIFLDGTVDKTGIGELPRSDRHIKALVVDETGKEIPGGYKFVSTQVSINRPPLQEIKNIIHLKSDGSALIKRRLIKHGPYAPSVRIKLKNPKKQRQSIVKYWNRSFPGAHVSKIISGNKDYNKGVMYKYSVKISSYGQKVQNMIIFRMALVPSLYYSSYGLLLKRKYPIVLTLPWELKEENAFIIPKGYRYLSTFTSYKINNSFILVKVNYEKKGRRLICKTHIKFKKRVISLDKYDELKGILLSIDKRELEKVIIQKIKEN